MTILAHFVLFWLGIALPAWSTSHQNSTDSSYPTRFRGVRWDNEQWKLVNTVLEPGRYQSRISLANGYLGINLAALGPFATIAGFYDYQLKLNSSNFPWLNQYGGESIISGIPHWAGLLVKTKSAILDASTDPTQIRNFQSSLDLKAGLMRWKFDWVLDGVQPMISIEYTMFVNKLHINRAAVQLKVKAAGDIELRVVDLLDGECAVRTDLVEKHHHSNSSTICSTVSPDGMAHLTGHVCSSLRSKAFSRSELFEGLPQLTDHSTSTIAQSASLKLKREQSVVVEKFIGAASGDAFSNPQAIALQSALAGADDGFAAQLDSHRKEWSSIMTEDSVDDYVELQILAITNPFHLLQNTLSSNAIALSDNSTALDNWSISAAQRIINYRVAQFPQAQENLKMAYSSSQNQTNQFSPGDAIYPWTSGRFGNCTASGPCFDYEYHINGDIGLSFYHHLVATGNFNSFKRNLLPIYQAIAGLFSNLLSETSDWKYGLRNATDPDEYANHVNNPAYTMFLMKHHLITANELGNIFGQKTNPIWSKQAENLALPIDNQTGIILEYEGMNSSIEVKQADVQSLNGPGMTYGVYSVVENRFQVSGCSSYTYQLLSSQPYVRAPWFQFSEQLVDDYSQNGGTHPAFPFLTGMGGDYRVTVYGYLGLRLELDHLRAIPDADPDYADAPIPVKLRSSTRTLKLKPQHTLTVPNRAVYMSNPLQCAPIKSDQAFHPGQFPISIADGSSATRWVPSDLPATITVQLNEHFRAKSIIDLVSNLPTSPNFASASSTIPPKLSGLSSLLTRP
ncbi:hypothetical protein PSTT_07160 [Puccinia striiformis]|uniref:alpha,alpha-trehalase n=1 Tax=Puccinia striiformis TaxID=27350 RepID=A0A2S4VHL8_9BASI|nr:hypothetical protein PSTT_07160 [Puccinia striiformis]